MKRFILSSLLLLICCISAIAQSGNPPILLTEADGSPRKLNPTKIIFANGTLTLDGSGAMTVSGPSAVVTAGQGGFFPYYGATSTGPSPGVGTISASNNQVRGRQFVLPFRATVAKCTIEITTNAAASVTNIAIYDAAGTTKLIETSFDSSTTGIKTNSFTAVTLEPGIYWLLHAASDATVQVRQLSSNSAWDAIMNNSTIRSGVSSLSMSGGVMPTTIGSISVASTNYPVMWFER